MRFLEKFLISVFVCTSAIASDETSESTVRPPSPNVDSIASPVVLPSSDKAMREMKNLWLKHQSSGAFQQRLQRHQNHGQDLNSRDIKAGEMRDKKSKDFAEKEAQENH